MANETLTTSINELSNIAVQEARLATSNLVDLRNFVMRRNVAEGSESARFPLYADGSATTLTEGADATRTAITTTGVVLTPDVNAHFSSRITDLASHNAPQIIADFGRVAGRAILRKINADIFATFDDFTTAIGSTGVDLTIAVVRSGIKTLMKKGFVNPVLVISPEVWDDLMTDAATTDAGNNIISDSMRDAVARGEQVPFYGATLIVVNGIDETADVKCGLYDAANAIGYAESWDVRVEFQRSAVGVGWDAVASSAYEVGVVNANAGIEILADGEDA